MYKSAQLNGEVVMGLLHKCCTRQQGVGWYTNERLREAGSRRHVDYDGSINMVV